MPADAKEGDFFFCCCLCHCTICPQIRRSGEGRHSSIFAGVKHGNKAARGISPFYYNPANARRVFDTFLTAFPISVPLKKIRNTLPHHHKKIMLKSLSICVGGGRNQCQPQPAPATWKERFTMSHVKFMSRSNAAEGTDIYFFFFPTRCLKASPTLKAILYLPPRLFFRVLFVFGFLGFFSPKKKNQIHRDLTEDFRKRLNPPSRAPGAAPTPCPHPQRFPAP